MYPFCRAWFLALANSAAKSVFCARVLRIQVYISVRRSLGSGAAGSQGMSMVTSSGRCREFPKAAVPVCTASGSVGGFGVGRVVLAHTRQCPSLRPATR